MSPAQRIFNTTGYYADGAYYHYVKDHVGNINAVVNSVTDTLVQSTIYYASGVPMVESKGIPYQYYNSYGVQPNQNFGRDEQPYLYNGKEFNEAHGLNEYDSQARYYYSPIGRTTTMDPLAENYYHISPYAWCGNNPIAFVDIDGTHPVYDENGIFLGTDDAGLQGDAIVMDNKLFSQNMSTEMAEAFDLGVDYLSEEALFTLNNHFNNLSLRPDWDGYITFDEATNWYRYGNGENLYANLGAIDLSGLVSLGEKYVGQAKSFNLLTCSNSLDAGLVYGQITLVRHPNHTVRAYADEYNFEMHPWNNPANWGRNIQTLIGGFVAGTGNPYNIYFYGNQTLQPKQPWIK